MIALTSAFSPSEPSNVFSEASEAEAVPTFWPHLSVVSAAPSFTQRN